MTRPAHVPLSLLDQEALAEAQAQGKGKWPSSEELEQSAPSKEVAEGGSGAVALATTPATGEASREETATSLFALRI